MERPTAKELAGGYFVPPVVIEDPPITARVWREEIFGPVLCIRVRFKTVELIRINWFFVFILRITNELLPRRLFVIMNVITGVSLGILD